MHAQALTNVHIETALSYSVTQLTLDAQWEEVKSKVWSYWFLTITPLTHCQTCETH